MSLVCLSAFLTLVTILGLLWNSYVILSFTMAYFLLKMECVTFIGHLQGPGTLKRINLHYAQLKKNVDPEQEHRHIRVQIYLSNDEVKVLRHSPKYETVDVISSVGGFMGCWLGIALMDILDIFGSIITVGRYAFRKTVKKLRIKAVVHVI